MTRKLSIQRFLQGEQGLTTLEWIAIVATVLSMLMFIPQVRGPIGNLYDDLIWGNTGTRGFLIGIGSFVIFGGSVFLLLYTNLGVRLGFLVSGAALSGMGAISGLLFVIYAPRGPRPADLEGLNAFQIRIMPGAMMLGAAILFAMFLAGLSRLEAADMEDE